MYPLARIMPWAHAAPNESAIRLGWRNLEQGDGQNRPVRIRYGDADVLVQVLPDSHEFLIAC